MEKELKLKYYQAAVELNNIAVALFEQRAYQKSIETFRDAINAMKVAVCPEDGFEIDFQNGPNIKELLLIAQNRLYLVLAPEQRRALYMVAPIYSLGDITSSEKGPFNHPLRIWQEYDPDMESPLILFNLAIVHKTMALHGQPQYMERSLKLNEMAYEIMSDTRIDLNEKRNERRVMLLVEILYKLIETKHELGRPNEVQGHVQSLVRISQIILTQQKLATFIQDSACAAVA